MTYSEFLLNLITIESEFKRMADVCHSAIQLNTPNAFDTEFNRLLLSQLQKDTKYILNRFHRVDEEFSI